MNEEDLEKDLVWHYLSANKSQTSEISAFIEVGANHPFGGSQTWHLEENGWIGILIEPQAKFFENLRDNRPNSSVIRAVCTCPSKVGVLKLHIPTEDGFATVDPYRYDFDVSFEEIEEVQAMTLDGIVEN